MATEETSLLVTYPGNEESIDYSKRSNNLQAPKDPFSINDRPSHSYGGLEDNMEASLVSNDPNTVLHALEMAVSVIRGQVEEEERRNRTKSRRPLLPLWLTNHILLLTFLIQVLGVGVLEIFHAINSNQESNSTSRADSIVFYSGDGILCLIEAVHLILVVLVSFKLGKQVLHHTASGTFLAQCYLSTVLLFAGIYTLEFRFKATSWEKVHASTSTHPVIVYLRMLYFSVSTATLCGTSTVEPLLWYSFMTVGIQMLLSFVYFASILSMAILPRKSSKVGPVKERSISRLIRRCLKCCASYYE